MRRFVTLLYGLLCESRNEDERAELDALLNTTPAREDPVIRRLTVAAWGGEVA